MRDIETKNSNYITNGIKIKDIQKQLQKIIDKTDKLKNLTLQKAKSESSKI